MIVILGEDAKRIPLRNVESDRRTIEWQDILQSRADGKQQLTLTQFSNDRVVDFQKNLDALLSRPRGTRIARNGGRSPGFLLSPASRSHHKNTFCRDRGILHVHGSVNPEPRAQSRVYHRSGSLGVVGNAEAKLGAVLWRSIALFEPSFRETFRQFGNQNFDVLCRVHDSMSPSQTGEVAKTSETHWI
jgi:hypothetical protein